MRKYTDLRVIEYDKSRNDQQQGGYKYLIRDVYAYTAYKTDKGFNDWLKRTNLTLELDRIDTFERDGELKTAKTYKAHGTIEERSFWCMDEVPENANMFKGLSNGSLVDCYYIHTKNGSEIYRPNPNAKNVYEPLSLEDHIEYQKING